MSLLSDTERTALGYWWNLITDAVREGFSATDTIQLANQVARDLGGSVSFEENRAISVLYGYARRIDNAGTALQASDAGKYIDSNMMAIAPYARDDQERSTYPLYHVKFEYVYRDQAGNIQTATKTDAFPLTLPGTVGDLTAEVLDDAEAMAAKYGHTLISATPLQILVV